MNQINQITFDIRGAAFKVHSALGPGLLESAYEACLKHELIKQGYSVQSQVGLPLRYDGIELKVGYRMDLLVEGQVIVELKAVRELTPVDTAQLLTYLSLSGMRLGLLMNFNVAHMRDGIHRYIR